MKDRHGRSALWSAVMGCVGAVLLSGTAHALPTTDSFVLGGNLNNAGSVHNLASLQSFPSVTQNVQYLSSGVPTEKTFTGVSLYEFLTSPGAAAASTRCRGLRGPAPVISTCATLSSSPEATTIAPSSPPGKSIPISGTSRV